MDRRAFIAALFGGAVTMRYGEPLDAAQQIEPVPLHPLIQANLPALNRWMRHYSYFFQAELRGQTERRMEIAIERNFLLNRVVWQGPEDTIIGIWMDNLLLAEGSENIMLLCKTCHYWTHSKANAERLYLGRGHTAQAQQEAA